MRVISIVYLCAGLQHKMCFLLGVMIKKGLQATGKYSGSAEGRHRSDLN